MIKSIEQKNMIDCPKLTIIGINLLMFPFVYHIPQRFYDWTTKCQTHIANLYGRLTLEVEHN